LEWRREIANWRQHRGKTRWNKTYEQPVGVAERKSQLEAAQRKN
jgi:hypothetical protein